MMNPGHLGYSKAPSLVLLSITLGSLVLFPVGPARAQMSVQVQNSGQSHSYSRVGDRHFFEVRDGDGDSAKGTHGVTDRSEVRFTKTGSNESLVTRNGEAVWFSFSFAVRHDRVPENWVSIFQFVPSNDAEDEVSKSPALAFEIDGRDLKVVTRTDARRSSTSNPRFTERVRLSDIPVSGLDQRPIYQDVVGRVVFGWENDAQLEIWLNGEKVVSESGVNIGYNDPDGPYPKAGLYRAASEERLQLVLRSPQFSFE